MHLLVKTETSLKTKNLFTQLKKNEHENICLILIISTHLKSLQTIKQLLKVS